MRTFGHGAVLGSLQGTQAELALVPNANLTLRKVPAGVSDDVALFAGDVMGTGYHAVVEGGVKPGDSLAVLGLGPVGLCAVQVGVATGAGPVFAIDTVAQRLEVARGFGAIPVHLTEQQPRDVIRQVTGGRGVDVAVATPTRSTRRFDSHARPARSSRSASTPSPAKCTWGWCGSRR
jgi:threonine dehydrogenase-like Zn-dependent dehydrogenase